MAFDKASYAPGEKMVLTVSAVDSTGAGVADGAKALFSTAGVTANVSLVGTLPAMSVTLANGVAKYTLYAPASGVSVVVTGTEGADTDNVRALGTPATITASAVIAGDTSAVDAANAATDAANAAADAADLATQAADAATTAAEDAGVAAKAAQDSADAALAAVTALGLRVAVLYAATRTQILTLTKLMVRIVKKTNA